MKAENKPAVHSRCILACMLCIEKQWQTNKKKPKKNKQTKQQQKKTQKNPKKTNQNQPTKKNPQPSQPNPPPKPEKKIASNKATKNRPTPLAFRNHTNQNKNARRTPKLVKD